MTTPRHPWTKILALIFGFVLLAAACSGESTEDSDDESSSEDAQETTSTTQAAVATTEASSGGSDADDDSADDAAEVEPASGTLRMVEFSPVTTFDPAGSQAAQSAYLYPVYDTLLLQNSEFGVEPNLATAWSSPEPTVWEFELRDDVVFHDGTPFDAQAAADNMLRSQAFEGNPNASTWVGMVGAEATDDYTLRVEFSNPQPQFPIQMTMVMGMMVSPAAFDTDMTRAPAGSGPWIWDDAQSQAGVTEIYTLNPEYWDPAKQGVEQVEVTAVPDNNARLNAGITGEAEIISTLRSSQIDAAEDEGWVIVDAQNFFPYISILGRTGNRDEALTDERVRQAILYSIDREAYVDATQDGKGSAVGGIYGPALADWHVPELDDSYPYDPDKARELLTEAGYPDGVTVTMPMMPAIQPHMEMVVQMLTSTGITVELEQINNGELGPRNANGEWDITWFRDLSYHPAADLGKFVDEGGRFNLDATDTADLSEKLAEASAASPEEAKALYAEVETALIDRGIVIPLGHGGQNNAYNPEVITEPVLGLNMQAAMPYWVRFVE